MTVGTTFDLIINRKWKEAISDTYFRRSRYFQSTTNRDDTYTCIEKPYLLWNRDHHTLKFLHVFKICNNIAHNIKCDTFQSDPLQMLLGIITYVQREWRRNRQELHQLQILMLDNNTLLGLNAKVIAVTPS